MEKQQHLKAYFKRKLVIGNYCVLHGIKKTPCPSCGFPTLNSRATYGYCFLCQWEDDGQDDLDADEVMGGPNGNKSLTQSRIDFSKRLQLNIINEEKMLLNLELIVAQILIWVKEFEELKNGSSLKYETFLDEFANSKMLLLQNLIEHLH